MKNERMVIEIAYKNNFSSLWQYFINISILYVDKSHEQSQITSFTRNLVLLILLFYPLYTMLKYLTNKDFDTTITSWVVMVDFFAEWCGPCKILAKLMPHLAKKFEGRATIAKVNTDEQQFLAGTYGITWLPTVILFKDGKEVERMRGLQPPEAYVEAIERWLADKEE